MVNANFWTMFGTGGSFTTGANTITANAGLLNAGGTVNINGGIVNVAGGLQVGFSNTAGIVNFSSGTVNTDVLIVGQSATGTFNHSGGTANISGDLTITTNGTYTASNSPIINIAGNWTNNKTFTAATSQTNFIGTANQIIAGTSQTTFSNLNINNAAGVTLNTSATSSGALNLTSGLLTTSGATVLTAAGTIPTYGASSYVNGKLARPFNSGAGSKIFPIGKGGNYRPLTFTYNSSSASNHHNC